VKPLSFIEVQELARAVVAVGDSFCCRRLLQRLDRGELELHEVLGRLSALRLESPTTFDRAALSARSAAESTRR